MVVAVLLLAAAFAACGAEDAAPSPGGRATTRTTEACDSYGGACNLTVIEKDGVKCAVYQAGGPNSARLWCSEGSAGTGGAQ